MHLCQLAICADTRVLHGFGMILFEASSNGWLANIFCDTPDFCHTPMPGLKIDLNQEKVPLWRNNLNKLLSLHF